MATFLICHGAWSAGWAWKKLRPLLRAMGHDIFTPSYTGLGERAHLVSPMVGLETHIADMLGVIECEDLREVILVGHSYGGMVATGVADRVPDRIRHLVYLDAFVPADGQSLDDLRGGNPVAAVDSWLVPPMPPAPDTAPEDLAWTGPRRRHQPARCFTEKSRLTGAVDTLRRTYIYCAKKGPGDVFIQFRDRFRDDPAWAHMELNESHSPNVTAPHALAQVLSSLT
jgi:pimeloyl-ACP methyl ester carboxylesterase